MKHSLFIYIAILFSTVMQAQLKNSISCIPQNILPFTSYPVTNSINTVPYQLQYKRHFKNMQALRLGTNLAHSNASNFTNDSTNNKYKNQNYLVGIGFEKKFKKSKTWMIGVGADYQYTYTFQKSTYLQPNSQSYSENKSNTHGAYPFTNVTAKFTSHVSLTLEMGFEINTSKGSNNNSRIYAGNTTTTKTDLNSDAVIFQYPTLLFNYWF